MNNYATPVQSEKNLIEMIFDCADNSSSREKLFGLAESFRHLPDLQTDTSLLQSKTIVDFLVHQIHTGNSDIISPEIIQESCRYILHTLLPKDKLIPLRLSQQGV